MLVIVDLEWVENEEGYVCPTQLAAIRTDEEWNTVDRFSAIIKPFNKSFQIWDHVAFRGVKQSHFLNGESMSDAFRRFFNWCEDTEAILFWAEETADVFAEFSESILRFRMPTIKLVSPIVFQIPFNETIYRKSPYYILQKTTGQQAEPNHCAVKDVENLRLLLSLYRIEPDWVLSGSLPEEYRLSVEEKTAMQRNAFLYCVDTKSGRIHGMNCPQAAEIPEEFCSETIEALMRKGYRPCKCCKETYWSISRSIVRKSVEKCGYSYVYSTDSKYFHKPNCIHVQRIPYVKLQGCTFFQSAMNNNRIPCGWCKPNEKDQIRAPKQSRKSCVTREMGDRPHTKAETKGSVWKTTRALSDCEKTALKRHDAAVKERTKTQWSKLTTEEFQDTITLTQPSYAFWAAAGYSTFHLRSCSKLQSMSSIKGFARFDDAIRAGLRPCRRCRPSSKQDMIVSVPIDQRFRKEENMVTLDALCDRSKFRHRYEEPDYYIETPAGRWKMTIGTVPVDLYHINLIRTPGNENEYHRQHRLFLSLKDTFAYIKRHDNALMKQIGKEKTPD